MISNSFALPPTRITLPFSVPKKSSTLHSSHHHPLMLARFGTLSTSFFIANQLHNFHPPLILNLYQACLHPSSLTKFSRSILLLSRVLPRPHLTPNLIISQLISLSLILLLKMKFASFYLSHPTPSVTLILYIPTSFLKHCLPALLPTITNTVNLSLSSGVFPQAVQALLRYPSSEKYNLDKEYLSNYRPISHLSLLSKLTERVVKLRLTHHLSSNHLLHYFQSAYTKYHSKESTLLSVHDHIIKAMGQQNFAALCFLDLSAPFDIIDHFILTHRLSSWFGLKGTALSYCLQSYIFSRSFIVNINATLSPTFPLLYCVHQGSVLGPLLFILYTTPLSSLISNSSVKHHLYAYDTQLFISFSAPDFSQTFLT